MNGSGSRATRAIMTGRLAAIGAIVAFALACDAPPSGFREGSPLDALPDYIEPVSELRAVARPAWAPDGRRFLYLDALVGNVFEFDLATGSSRPLTQHFSHSGFTRAHYLANGDLLLCGPAEVDPDDPERGRWNARFWLLESNLQRAALPLDERCFEGPAVARNSMRIAWVRTDLPEKMLTARSELWTGIVEPNGDRPRIVEARKLADRWDFFGLGMLEPQDFRPPDEGELLFTAYAWRGGEAMGVDLSTGAIENYSKSPWYEEIEGVTPDGRYALIEREFSLRANPRGAIDLWLLRLDGSGESVRMTRFSEFSAYGANNPVVSPDCRTMLFALRKMGGAHGNSAGLLRYDLERSPLAPPDLCRPPAAANARPAY